MGGHTVEVDVPADAAFTDTINSDITAEGNPVILKELQGGVPFSEITVKGENISGQEMTLIATGKNQLPITITSGTGAGVTYTVDNDEITVSGTTTGVTTIIISAPNITITEDMRLSYRGNLSGMTPKATILRNGETVYPTPNDTTGSKLLAGDVLQNVYIQQQSADVAVSGSAKFQLEYGTEVTEYEKYSSEICTFTPDSIDYVIPTDVIQKEGINILAINAEDAVLSATGVKTNAAVAKLWNKPGYDDTEIKENIKDHVTDTDIHVTTEEKATWSKAVTPYTAEGGASTDYEGYFKPENENGLYLLNIIVDITGVTMLAPLSFLVNFNGTMPPKISALPYDSDYTVSGSTYTFGSSDGELFKVYVSNMNYNGKQMAYVKITNVNLESISTKWNANVRFVKLSD